MLLKDIAATLKPPKPPMQEVDYGGTKRMEPNPAHPDYKEAMTEYQAKLNDLMFRVLVVIGVECEVDSESVKKVREQAGMFGAELPPEDKFVYIAHVLAKSEDDVKALRDLLLRRSQPTEAATAEAVDRFPAEVQGN